MSVNYNLTVKDGVESLTVFIDGVPETVATTHQHFAEIKDILVYNEEYNDSEVAEHLKTLVAARRNVPTLLAKLSDRVGFAGGAITFDGEPLDNSLSRFVLRLVEEGGEYQPWVLFMEHLAINPSQTSRRQLFSWLQAENFTLTPEGFIVGYKSVQTDRMSHTSGTNTVFVSVEGVNVAHTGKVPNPDGAVVSITRNEVDPNRDQECSYGLHVGTHNYAAGFQGLGGYSASVVLEVHVNPRDVVAVPRDYNGAKMRVSQYVVVGEVESKYDEAVKVPTFTEETGDELFPEEEAVAYRYDGSFEPDDNEDPEWCDYCGEGDHDTYGCDEYDEDE